MKKNLTKLFESEIEKAEITLAVRDISDKLQKIASDLSRTTVDDVPSIVERIKATHGVEAGNEFGQIVTDKIGELTDKVIEVKSSIDDRALVLSGDADSSDFNSKNDMEDDEEMDFDDSNDEDTDMGSDFENEDNDADKMEPPSEPPLGRKVKKIKNENVLGLLEKCGPKKKNVISEMYHRGGKSRQKVLDLAKKVK